MTYRPKDGRLLLRESAEQLAASVCKLADGSTSAYAYISGPKPSIDAKMGVRIAFDRVKWDAATELDCDGEPLLGPGFHSAWENPPSERAFWPYDTARMNLTDVLTDRKVLIRLTGKSEELKILGFTE